MTTLEELKNSIAEKLCNRRYEILGLVEQTRDKNGFVLRNLNSGYTFNPITYSQDILIFFVINGLITISKSKIFPLPVQMVVLTDDYNDIPLVIEALDAYDFLPVEASLDSQQIYDKYFEIDVNKPFQGYGMELNLSIKINYKELFIND